MVSCGYGGCNGLYLYLTDTVPLALTEPRFVRLMTLDMPTL